MSLRVHVATPRLAPLDSHTVGQLSDSSLLVLRALLCARARLVSDSGGRLPRVSMTCQSLPVIRETSPWCRKQQKVLSIAATHSVI